MVADGETGFTVAPGDEKQLAERIVSLLGNDDLQARMSAAARDRFEQRFGPERYAAQIDALYSDIAEHRYR